MITKEGIIDMIWKDKEYKLACRNIAKGDELYKDMFQELIIILCQYDEQKLIAVYNRGEIKYFIVAIVSRMWHSPRHPFYKLYREPFIEFKEHVERPELDNLVFENEEEEHHQQMMKAAADVKKQLEKMKKGQAGEWYSATVLENYLEVGSFRKLSDQTRIPRKSLADTTKKTIEDVKKSLRVKRYLERYLRKNRRRKREADKRYYRKNQKKKCEAIKADYRKNQKKKQDYKKQYYEANKEKILKQAKEYYKANADKIKLNKILNNGN